MAVLHLQPDQATTTAAWSEDGWPPLIPWDGTPAAAPLYWLMRELPVAAAAADWEIVDDFLDEAATWLDRIWRPPPARQPPHPPAATAAAITATLWGELQRGRGSEDAEHLAYHARLLQQLLAPADPARRPPAIPAYLPPARRITDGQLPRHDRFTAAGEAARPGQRPQHEQFLLQVLMVLSNRSTGHLSDHVAHRCPPGAAPERTGWTRSGQRPIGELLGSIDTAGAHLLLRPDACLTAVDSPAGWTAAMIGEQLAAAWLVDSTLNTVAAVRRPTVDRAVIDNQAPEPVWLFPLTVFHPGQFFHVTPLRPRPFR